MAGTDIHTYLSKHPFFRDFDDEYVEFLSRHAAKREFAAGDLLFRQGERSEQFFVVRAGRVNVEVPSVYGPSLVVQRLGPDQVLGWSWLIAPYLWDFQAVAETATRVVEFDAPAILERCERDSGFGYVVLKAFTTLMSERLRAARRRMMEQFVPSGFA